jgi:hypothetical protein
MRTTEQVVEISALELPQKSERALKLFGVLELKGKWA